jgi:hypothetical protein
MRVCPVPIVDDWDIRLLQRSPSLDRRKPSSEIGCSSRFRPRATPPSLTDPGRHRHERSVAISKAACRIGGMNVPAPPRQSSCWSVDSSLLPLSSARICVRIRWASQHRRCPDHSMRERLNFRGDTWRRYLRTLWWRLPLIAGLCVVLWLGTDREKLDYMFALFAIVLINVGWDIWQNWRRSP